MDSLFGKRKGLPDEIAACLRTVPARMERMASAARRGTRLEAPGEIGIRLSPAGVPSRAPEQRRTGAPPTERGGPEGNRRGCTTAPSQRPTRARGLQEAESAKGGRRWRKGRATGARQEDGQRKAGWHGGRRVRWQHGGMEGWEYGGGGWEREGEAAAGERGRTVRDCEKNGDEAGRMGGWVDGCMGAREWTKERESAARWEESGRRMGGPESKTKRRWYGDTTGSPKDEAAISNSDDLQSMDAQSAASPETSGPLPGRSVICATGARARARARQLPCAHVLTLQMANLLPAHPPLVDPACHTHDSTMHARPKPVPGPVLSPHPSPKQLPHPSLYSHMYLQTRPNQLASPPPCETRPVRPTDPFTRSHDPSPPNQPSHKGRQNHEVDSGGPTYYIGPVPLDFVHRERSGAFGTDTRKDPLAGG